MSANVTIWGSYDQVIALTQYVINVALQAQYDAVGEPSPVDSVDEDYSNQGFYNAVFGPPRIILDYAPDLSKVCIYQLIISSGTLKVFNSDTKDANGHKNVTSFAMNNFKLACPADIALTNLSSTPRYDAIRRKMNVPGDYSIKQLIVDFESAQTSMMKAAECDFGTWTNQDWILSSMTVQTPPASVTTPTNNYWRPTGWKLGEKRVLTDAALKRLETCLNNALVTALMDSESKQLGFVATASPGPQPTFTPTDVSFQTYPWYDSASNPVPPSLDGNARMNYLLYREMVDGNQRDPRIVADLTPTGVNFTTGTDPDNQEPSLFGTYVLARQCFLEKWFIPQLEKVIRSMDCAFAHPHVDFTENSDGGLHIAGDFTLAIGAGCQPYGVADPRDAQYALGVYTTPPVLFMSRMPEIARNRTMQTLPNNAQIWYYTNLGDYGPLQDSNTTHYYHQTLLPHWNCSTSMRVNSAARFSLLPGERKATLEGFSDIDWGYTFQPKANQNHSEGLTFASNHVTVTWSLNFELGEVDDGGLSINISEPVVNYDWSTFATDWKYVGGPQDGQPFDAKADFQAAYQRSVANLDNLLNDMRNGLAHSHKFFFPSRGRFLFKNPRFSVNGDLLCNCAYNGDETGDLNPDAPARPDTTQTPEFHAVPDTSAFRA